MWNTLLLFHGIGEMKTSEFLLLADIEVCAVVNTGFYCVIHAL